MSPDPPSSRLRGVRVAVGVAASFVAFAAAACLRVHDGPPVWRLADDGGQAVRRMGLSSGELEYEIHGLFVHMAIWESGERMGMTMSVTNTLGADRSIELVVARPLAKDAVLATYRLKNRDGFAVGASDAAQPLPPGATVTIPGGHRLDLTPLEGGLIDELPFKNGSAVKFVVRLHDGPDAPQDYPIDVTVWPVPGPLRARFVTK